MIAGGAARAVLELAGIRDIPTKSYGTNNKINMVKATLEGLKQLRSAEEVAKLRGKTVRRDSGLRRTTKMKLQITLKKSPISSLQVHKDTVAALGLHKVARRWSRRTTPASAGRSSA